MNSIYWHDYETFGGDPRRDRPCQFAGIRTDEELNVIGEPLELYCRPAPDFLPDPVSCRITGISPQLALEQGVREAEFCQRILQEFSEPGTCVSGYNSIRFDDEVTRHLLYRCFHDPYEREWKHGNSRWDLIDVLRATRALRPEGITWPDKEDGTPSFRLEELTAANGIAHADAHDALADVQATIAMARLVKQKQPRLYDYLYQLRNKHKVLPLLDLARQDPVVHISGMFPATRGCLGIVMPLLKHPDTNNGIIVVDLLADPAPWLQLPAEEIRRKLYTPRTELQEGEARIGLKTVHINRCPVLAPLNVLHEGVQQRYALNLAQVQQYRERVLGARHLAERLREVFTGDEHEPEADPDFMLYSGGFFDDHDKRLMQKLQRLPPRELAALGGQFHDARVPELLFRYRARNWPEQLTPEEAARWTAFCRARLSGERDGAGPALPRFTELLTQEAAALPPELHAQLQQYASELARRCGLA